MLVVRYNKFICGEQLNLAQLDFFLFSSFLTPDRGPVEPVQSIGNCASRVGPTFFGEPNFTIGEFNLRPTLGVFCLQTKPYILQSILSPNWIKILDK